MPFPPIFGNVFKVKILGQGQSSSLCAPSRQTREAIGRIADDRQEIRNGLRFYSELRHDSVLIAQDFTSALHRVGVAEAKAGERADTIS
jgi:hypothetical protein